MVARWRKETTWMAGQVFKTIFGGGGGSKYSFELKSKTILMVLTN
jgi:hypothetical protein